MEYLFCPGTMGFYPGGLTGDAVGLDYITLTEDEYRALAGHALTMGEDGRPTIAALLPPSAAEQEAIERAWRDVELASVAWLRDRHRDQLEIGVDTTLDADQFPELLLYMQSLRDWPQSDHFPDIEFRPHAPGWIAEQTQ